MKTQQKKVFLRTRCRLRLWSRYFEILRGAISCAGQREKGIFLYDKRVWQKSGSNKTAIIAQIMKNKKIVVQPKSGTGTKPDSFFKKRAFISFCRQRVPFGCWKGHTPKFKLTVWARPLKSAPGLFYLVQGNYADIYSGGGKGHIHVTRTNSTGTLKIRANRNFC